MTPRPGPSDGASVSPRVMLLAWVIAGAWAAALATLVFVQQRAPFPQRRIGGDFTLVDTTGHRVTQADLRGKPTVVYFGFTYCPEVCPTTLNQLSVALRTMGPIADRLNVVFVSVDPQRDTPAQMRLYLSSFDPRIRGFTGTEEQVADAARAFHVRYRRVPLANGDYTVDHSASVLLFDRTAKLVGIIDYGSDDEDVRVRLTALAEPGACHPGVPAPAALWGPWRPGARSRCGARCCARRAAPARALAGLAGPPRRGPAARTCGAEATLPSPSPVASSP